MPSAGTGFIFADNSITIAFMAKSSVEFLDQYLLYLIWYQNTT